MHLSPGSACPAQSLPRWCPSAACRPRHSPCRSTVYQQLPRLTTKRDRDQGCGLQHVLARGRYEGMCFSRPRALVSVPSDAPCTTFCWPLRLVTTAQQHFKMRNCHSSQASQSSGCWRNAARPRTEHAQSSQNSSKTNTETQVSTEHVQGGTSQNFPSWSDLSLLLLTRSAKRTSR